MNTSRLKTKKIWIPALAVVAVLGAGGAAMAANGGPGGLVGGDDRLSGSTLDRASAAALAAVGEGTVTDAERDDADDDDATDGVYEVEVTKDDGTQVDVDLDEDFEVVAQDTDDTDGAGDADPAGPAGSGEDDLALGSTERDRAAAAAVEAVPGTVTGAEREDGSVGDRAVAYEVEVVTADLVEWTVRLDSDYRVLEKVRD